MEKLDLILAGTITGETDLAVSPHGHQRPAGRQKVATLPTKRVFNAGKVDETAYLPAGTLRGRLRNLLAKAILEDAAGRGDPMTPGDYLLTAKGGIKDRKVSEEREVDYKAAAQLRAANPVVSLFGAMAEKIAGRLCVEDAVPVEPVAPNHKGQGVRAHPFQREPELVESIDPESLAAFMVEDAARVRGNEAETAAEQLGFKIGREKGKTSPDADAIEQWKAEATDLETQAKAAFAEAGGAVNIQQLLPGFDTIPAGLPMTHRMELRGATATEAAFLLVALRLLARDGYIGAHRSRGCGRFRADYEVQLAVDGGDFEPAGRITLADHQLTVETDNQVLADLRDQADTLELQAFDFHEVA